MCVVLPVDHVPCSHTVAIWQHCIHALRSCAGLKPCSRIRQHARPILTRKLCIHCGGPRYFARRGGIAERGNGSRAIAEKKELGSPYDSGYCSDIIHEEEEGYETDSTLSPRAAKVPTTWRAVSRQNSPSTRQPHSHSSSWKPNLKNELTHRESIDSRMSGYNKSRKMEPSQSPMEMTPPQRSASPILQRPSPERKNSTLLHPSSPVEMPADDDYTRNFTMGELTPPATPPAPRKGSTLLHPSSPDSDRPMNILDAKPFVSILALPTPTTAEPSPICTSVPLLGAALPPRKSSTLLHPSSPSEDEISSNIQILSLSSPPEPATAFPFPTFTETPPTPASIFQRRASVLHSCLSDDEWEEPLHSSQSDVEYESDSNYEKGADADTESFDDKAVNEVAVVAKTGRLARASRISFHGQNFRIVV